MAQIAVSEFRMKSLDRAARFAGEVFGSEEAMGRDGTEPRASSGMGMCMGVVWAIGGVVALGGLFLLVG